MFIILSSLLLYFKIKQNLKTKREFIYINKDDKLLFSEIPSGGSIVFL